MKTGLALSVLLVLGAAEACKQAASTEASTIQKDPSSATNDDQADAPAPVAGAYLTCLVAKPKANDDYLNAGCQIRNPSKIKVDCKSLGKHLWSYLPPKGTGGAAASAATTKAQPPIEVFDLCNDAKKNYYFQVGMRMKIAKPAAGLALSGAQRLSARDLALFESERKRNAEFFLGLKPVIVFNPMAKNGAGLRLTEDAAPLTGPKAVVSQGTLSQQNTMTLNAKNRPDDPAYIPGPVLEAARIGDPNSVISGVFDPGTGNVNVAPASETPAPVAATSGGVFDALPPEQQATVKSAEVSGGGTDAAPLPADTPIDNNPYFSNGIDATSATQPPALDPLACAAALEPLKDQFASRVIDEERYVAECKKVTSCDEASCAVPAAATGGSGGGGGGGAATTTTTTTGT